MVKAAGKNGRTRRSGGRGRAGRGNAADVAAVVEENVSVGMAGQEETDDGTAAEPVDGENPVVTSEPVGTEEDDAFAESTGEDAAEPFGRDGAEAAGASGGEPERIPGALDILRGEVLSEELEQNAVEQMFRWMKEQEAEGKQNGGAELSGAALLESVHHGRHVAELSLFLFEALASRFGLDMIWARRLVQAALWHDLGFAESGRRRHHKRSMEIIESNRYLTLAFDLDESDRPLVALLARYHRRAWPSMKHRRFAALSEEDRKSLCGAAAVLRIADALDFRHKGAVEELRVTMRRRLVRITCFGAESCRKECRRALKKGDFFEKLYGGRLEVEQGKEGDRDAH